MADLGFDGKVAIITGAGGGLGRSHALDLAKRGALLVINDLGGLQPTASGTPRPPPRRSSTRSRPPAARPSPTTTAWPPPRAAQSIVKTAVDTFGKVDIIINNAGILRDTSFKNMTPDQVNPVLDVHLRGAFYVTQPAWQLMRDQGYGRIINTASGAGIFGNFGQTNYGAAKMGLVGLTRVLAIEGAKNNIKVNAIAPVAKTRMTEELFGAADGQALHRSSSPRSSPTSRTRTAPSPARCTRSAAAGSPASSWASRPATTRPTSPRGRARQLRQDPRRGGLRGARQPQRRDDARLQVDGLTSLVRAPTPSVPLEHERDTRRHARTPLAPSGGSVVVLWHEVRIGSEEARPASARGTPPPLPCASRPTTHR